MLNVVKYWIQANAYTNIQYKKSNADPVCSLTKKKTGNVHTT
jgi:hypothetical protein